MCGIREKMSHEQLQCTRLAWRMRWGNTGKRKVEESRVERKIYLVLCPLRLKFWGHP